MNSPTSTRRVFTDAEKAVYNHIRQELAFWAAEHRRHKSKNLATAMRLCALHKALNRLRLRPDCHVVKQPDRGYDDAQVQALATRLLADALVDIGQPLRCYVVVCTHWQKRSTPSQLFVQAAHALAELMKHYSEHVGIRQWADVDRTLIICQGNPPSFNLGVYAPCASTPPCCGFVDEHYGQTPLAYALYPITERHAQVMGLTDRALL